MEQLLRVAALPWFGNGHACRPGLDPAYSTAQKPAGAAISAEPCLTPTDHAARVLVARQRARVALDHADTALHWTTP